MSKILRDALVEIRDNLRTSWQTRTAEQIAAQALEQWDREHDMGARVIIDYTNYKGHRAEREIVPIYSWYGASEYHKEDGDQWFWKAVEVGRDVVRDFAVKDIHSWRPAREV
jgi:hypothetical protein